MKHTGAIAKGSLNVYIIFIKQSNTKRNGGTSIMFLVFFPLLNNTKILCFLKADQFFQPWLVEKAHEGYDLLILILMQSIIIIIMTIFHFFF